MFRYPLSSEQITHLLKRPSAKTIGKRSLQLPVASDYAAKERELHAYTRWLRHVSPTDQPARTHNPWSGNETGTTCGLLATAYSDVNKH